MAVTALIVVSTSSAKAEYFVLKDGGRFNYFPSGGWNETPPPHNNCCVHQFLQFSRTNNLIILYDQQRLIYIRLPIPQGMVAWTAGSVASGPWTNWEPETHVP